MRRTSFLLAGLCILTVSGCTKKIEKLTPIGTVPPPTNVQPLMQEEKRSFGQDTKSMDGGPAVDSRIMRGSAPNSESIATGTLQRFSDAYKFANEPRMVIFLNRSLSDEVSEWVPLGRISVSGEGTISKSGKNAGKSSYNEKIMGPVAITAEEYTGIGGERAPIEEGYLWAFEDGFTRAFLQTNARLLDRATIMRALAASKDKGMGPKQVEMDALSDKADIYIEILIARSPGAQYGYEFKATAKEVKTGRILANSTSLNWRKKTQDKIVVTSAGYEIVNSQEQELPGVGELSKDLAIDLMNTLSTIWKKGN